MKKPFKSFVVDKDFEGSRVDRFLKKKFPRYFTSVNREFSLEGSSSRADFRFSRSGCRRRELPAVVSWRLALRRAAFVTHARGEQVESLDRSARRARVRRVIRASVVAEVPPPRNRGPGDKCRVGRHGQEQDKDQEVRGGQACTEPQGGARGQGQENEEEARRRARSETHVRLPLPHLAAARAKFSPVDHPSHRPLRAARPLPRRSSSSITPRLVRRTTSSSTRTS